MGKHDGFDVDDETPTTSFAVPQRPASVVRAGDVGAGLVSSAFRGADQVGAVVAATGRGVSRQVRTKVRTRWPSAPPGVQVASPGAAPEPIRARFPIVPVVAILACVAGLLGMTLPVLDLGGVTSFAMLDIPYVGLPTTLGFLLLTLLPVIDVVQRRTRWTSWLLIPAVLGLLPVGLLVFAVSLAPRLLHLVWAHAPEKALGVGAAGMTLGSADAALVVLGFLAVLVRVRVRSR